MSDGVHDNLDPQCLGKTPLDLGVPSKDSSWESVLDEQLGSETKSKWACATLDKLIEQAFLDKPISPATRITTTLIDHVKEVTAASRNFMETHPNDKLPNDSTLYPGKVFTVQHSINLWCRWTMRQCSLSKLAVGSSL